MGVLDATDGPHWLSRFIAQVGVPAAIAVGLTYFLTWTVAGNLSAITAAQTDQLKLLIAHAESANTMIANQARTIALVVDHDRNQQRLVAVSMANCVNNAGDNQARKDRCFAFSVQDIH